MSTQKDLILREIDHLLEAFQEQYAEARQHSGQIPLIEMDLMKQSVRNLYQQLHYLEKRKEIENIKAEVSYQTPEATSTPPPQEVIAEIFSMREVALQKEHEEVLAPLKEEPVPPALNIITETVPNIQIEESVIEEVIAIHELPIELEKSPEISVEPSLPEVEMMHRTSVLKFTETPVLMVLEKESVKKQVAITASLFDEPAATLGSKFKGSDTIYDKISQGHNDESLARKHQQQPLADLRKSIGINERFSFINELFNGNQKSYYENIDRINALNNYLEARTLIHGELAVQLKWSPASPAFIKLDELVKRRFSS